MFRATPVPRRLPILLSALLAATACERVDDWLDSTLDRATGGSDSDEDDAAVAIWTEADSLTTSELEAGRYDDSWRDAIELPLPPIDEFALDTIAIPESFADLANAQVAAEPAGPPPVHLPLGGDVEGPSVLYAQILLDRARFSPGILDGRWGKNTEKAVLWFQHDAGLPPTGIVDSTTFAALVAASGTPDDYVTARVLTEDDVEGPFVDIPADVYDMARLRCLCYRSLSEKLAETFHASPAVLAELNPDRALDSLAAGDTLVVPDLEGPVSDAPVAAIVINGAGYYVHAVDSTGAILFHFPTTLGGGYDPSPEGDLEVVSVHPDPWFHYQPALLAGRDPSMPTANLPPGPNSLVGDTWIKLSAPHYGIHGTSAPETIGYATSSGCVRLTNWDARFLRERVGPGTRVEFRETRTRAEGADAQS